MNTKDIFALQTRIEAVVPMLNEYQRRRYLSAEAKAIGYGGISLVSSLTGVSRQTLTDGIKELDDPNGAVLEQGRSRKSGGGRKPVWETQPGILEALSDLVSAHTKGDPMCSLLWTNKSLRNLEKGMKEQGYEVSHRVVGILLERLGYALQADKKTLTVKPSHPDRDAQFEHINEETTKAAAAGNPVLSIDAKKKENIGNFKNNGRTYQKKKTPVKVLDHDFPIPELGKATPFGVYNIFKNQGFVNVGLSADTATFAVESLRKWWYAEGVADYASAQAIVVTADCGGSNGYRNRLWKYELQGLANEIGKAIEVHHYPPGTSKWNKIEHRLFSFISKNWQGIPLISAAVIVSLIGETKTEKGLAVSCVLDENSYETGRKVTDGEFSTISISASDFHGEWNYTILPNNK
jgi:transposase